MIDPFFETQLGKLYVGDCKQILNDYIKANLPKVDLLFTSPPFPLNRKKKYGNMTGDEYLEWISSLAPLFSKMISDTGSIVIEIGNAWEKGCPIHSTLPIEALLKFKESGNLFLCQEFIHYNPSSLPSPIEWVNKRRVRVKDSFSRLWWLSKTSNPKADNRQVLKPYSTQMLKLLKSKNYNSGKRPSQHVIGMDSFKKDNGGSIPGNVIISSNTRGNEDYLRYCKKNNLDVHPARMSREVADFFIRFLTKEGDIVLDPFSGSNMTGYVSEELNRKWISVEINSDYAKGSIGRFNEDGYKERS